MTNAKIWRDTIHSKICDGPTCRRRIWFGQLVKSGKFMCFDQDPDNEPIITEREVETNREMLTVDLDGNHFATCPDRARFSKRGRR